MKLKIAGCRGSLPSPAGRDLEGNIFSTEEFGGNTNCYYLQGLSNIMKTFCGYIVFKL